MRYIPADVTANLTADDRTIADAVSIAHRTGMKAISSDVLAATSTAANPLKFREMRIRTALAWAQNAITGIQAPSSNIPPDEAQDMLAEISAAVSSLTRAADSLAAVRWAPYWIDTEHSDDDA